MGFNIYIYNAIWQHDHISYFSVAEIKHQKKKEKGEGNTEKGLGYLFENGTKNCLWTERRQMWHTEKWQFVKI